MSAKRLNPKMNPKVKKKWVEALRSEKYKQGRVYLKYYDKKAHRTKHCCLGVLCDISKKSKWESRKSFKCKFYENTFDFLPYSVSKYASLKSKYKYCSNLVGIRLEISDPIFEKIDIAEIGIIMDGERKHVDTNLATLNDKDVSFKDIARIIEEYL